VEKPSTSVPSPPSPKRWHADAFSWPRSLIVLVWLSIAFIVGQVLAYFALRQFGTTTHDLQTNHLTWGITIAQFLNYVPLLAVLFGAMPWLSRTSLRDLGLRGFDRTTILAGLIGATAMYAAAVGIAGVQYAFTHEKPEEAAISLFASTHDPALIFAFTFLATVAAPFVEEFIFRGFLFNALVRYAPVWVAAVVSGALFGYVHIINQSSASAFLPLAASGVVLAYVYQRSGSLTAAIMTHGLFNLINVTLISVTKAS
jgi:membrane protease YdiL (CAAX protease family)